MGFLRALVSWPISMDFKNIYDTQVWTPEHVRYGILWTAIRIPSPPATAFVMAPIGLLPLNVASVSWVVISAG